ncbi:MAG: hypothetical protein HQM06_01925 [Magnetococcales bacterium]|nr:hypothetical protein [Magnetococcales bacterium]
MSINSTFSHSSNEQQIALLQHLYADQAARSAFLLDPEGFMAQQGVRLDGGVQKILHNKIFFGDVPSDPMSSSEWQAQGFISTISHAVSDAASSVADIATDAASSVADIATDAASSVADIASDAADSAADTFNSVSDAVEAANDALLDSAATEVAADAIADAAVDTAIAAVAV